MADKLPISLLTTDAEECLLGAILIDADFSRNRDCINRVAQILKPADFKGCTPTDRPERWIRNARIFYAMLNTSEPPNAFNTAFYLSQNNMLEVHDAEHMRHCEWVCPCSLDYLDYAKAVKEYSTQRQVEYFTQKGDMDAVKSLIETGETPKHICYQIKTSGKL